MQVTIHDLRGHPTYRQVAAWLRTVGESQTLGSVAPLAGLEDQVKRRRRLIRAVVSMANLSYSETSFVFGGGGSGSLASKPTDPIVGGGGPIEE